MTPPVLLAVAAQHMKIDAHPTFDSYMAAK